MNPPLVQSVEETSPARPAAGISPAERARLAVLRRLGAAQALAEQNLQDIAEVAATVCGTSFAAINIIDSNAQVTIAGYGLATGTVVPRHDAPHQDELAGGAVVHVTDLGLAFSLAAPILGADGHVLGAVCVMDAVSRDVSAAQIGALEALARVVESLLVARTHVVDLLALSNRLTGDTEADTLTGLPTRTVVEPMLARLPVGTSVALISLDQLADPSEDFPDEGQEAADRALTAVAALLRGHCRRPGDLAIRWGTHEFLLILPACPPQRAIQIAQTVRSTWQAADTDDNTSLSIGVTSALLDEDAATVLTRADAAMTHAQGNGKATGITESEGISRA